jgi:uncharacterized protein
MRNGYLLIITCIALTFGVIAGFNLLGAGIILAAYGTDVKAADPAGLILINSISQVVMLIGLPLILVKGLKHSVKDDIRHTSITKKHIPLFLIAILLTISGQMFGTALSSIWMDFLSLFPALYSSLQELQKIMDEMMAEFTRINSLTDLAIMLFGIGLIPAISEEFFFRGFLLTHIERSGESQRTAIAIIITSLLFGVSHFSPFNFPGLVMLGALFAWIMVTSGSIYISMFSHFINNATIVLILYFFQDDKRLSDSLTGTVSIKPIESLPLLLISAGAIYGLAKVFHNQAGKLEPKDE